MSSAHTVRGEKRRVSLIWFLLWCEGHKSQNINQKCIFSRGGNETLNLFSVASSSEAKHTEQLRAGSSPDKRGAAVFKGSLTRPEVSHLE